MYSVGSCTCDPVIDDLIETLIVTIVQRTEFQGVERRPALNACVVGINQHLELTIDMDLDPPNACHVCVDHVRETW